MDNNDADISICGYTKFSEKDNIIESKDYKEYVYTTKEAMRELIKQRKNFRIMLGINYINQNCSLKFYILLEEKWKT